MEDALKLASQFTGVPLSILRAMATVESSGNAAAVSPRGARGLLQVMPSTAESLGFSSDELLDPYSNAMAGAMYMRQLADRFGDWRKALAAYNAGPARVDYRTRENIPLPNETRSYLSRISATSDDAAQALLASMVGGAP